MKSMPTDQQADPSRESARNPRHVAAGMVLIGVAILVVLFGPRLLRTSDPALPTVPAQSPAESAVASGDALLEVGDLAGDFSLPDPERTSFQLSAFRGRPVVLNFWATWCAPCRVEMPELQAAYEAHQDEGLVILALNFDETSAQVSSFFYEEFDLTFTPLLDDGGRVAEQYGVYNFPSTFFLDRNGRVSAIHRGPLIREQIDDLLAGILPQDA